MHVSETMESEESVQMNQWNFISSDLFRAYFIVSSSLLNAVFLWTLY